jgi:hypothetical protein
LNARLTVFVAVVVILLASQSLPLSLATPSDVPSQAVGLALTIIPPKLPADGGTYPAIVVSLVDSNGLPSSALTDLMVFLTSSQTNTASVPDTVTIPAGSEYVVANAVTTSTPGTTSITASSHGLVSKFAQLTTATPSGFPSKLKVFVSPTSLLKRADSGSVRVELVDDAGYPSKALSSITVLLSSSNASIAGLDQSSLTLNPGDIYTTGTFHTFSNSGQAVITASSTGYGSGGAVVAIVLPCTTSCGASELLLKLVPATLPTDGGTYKALQVGLATSSGLPAVSSSDTIVQIFSDKPGIVSVPDFVTIPAGSISVLAALTTSSLPGHSSLTATSSSLLPGNANVTTVIPAPSRVQEYLAPPSTFVTSIGNSPILVVQLQDSNGNPARARIVTDITVTSSNKSIVKGPLSLTVPVGQDYVSTLLAASGSGKSTLTSSAQGLVSAQVDLQLARSPLIAQLSAYVPKGTLYSNGTATMTLSVTFLGKPIQNLNVSWSATGGSMSPPASTTGSSGSTSSRFTPNGAGNANVTASASSPQTGPFSQSYAFTVFQAQAPKLKSLLDVILSLWYLLVAVIAVVAVAAFYLLRMRRKKQRAEIEAGFEVV